MSTPDYEGLIEQAKRDLQRFDKISWADTLLLLGLLKSQAEEIERMDKALERLADKRLMAASLKDHITRYGVDSRLRDLDNRIQYARDQRKTDRRKV